MADTPTTDFNAAPATETAPLLDAERLDVYRVALQLQVETAGLATHCDSVLRDPLRRASLSIPLNIAEAAGRRSIADRRRFYAIARGSATECAAIVDVLRIRDLVPASDCSRARTLLVRIVQMPTKLDRSLG